MARKVIVTGYRVEEVREFYGSEWTEDPDSPHNGGCCDEDAKILEQFERENEDKS